MVFLVVAFSFQNRLVVLGHDFVVGLAYVLHLQDVVLDDELVSEAYLQDVADDGEEDDDCNDLESVVELYPLVTRDYSLSTQEARSP